MDKAIIIFAVIAWLAVYLFTEIDKDTAIPIKTVVIAIFFIGIILVLIRDNPKRK